jgi:hypothetical protein
MATNYGGFADGFSKGFGIVQDSLNNQRYNDLRELDIKERRETQRLAQQDRAEDRKFRDEQAALAAQDRRNTETYRREQNTISQQNADLDRDLKQSQLDYNSARITTEQEAAKRARDDADRDDRIAAQGLSAQYLQSTLSGVRTGEVDLSDQRVVARIAKEYETVFGTPMDFAIAGDPAVDSINNNLGTALQNMATGQQFNEQHVLDAVNLLVKNSTQSGQVIDENSQYAPEAYRGGDWKIVSRKVTDLQTVATDGSEGSANTAGGVKFSGNVLVTIQNSEGRQAIYQAPMTEGRGLSGQQVEFSLDDLMNGYQGHMTYLQEMKPYYRDLVSAVSQSVGTPAVIKEKKDAYKLALRKTVEDDGLGDMMSEYGVTFNNLLSDGELLERVAEQSVLFGRTDTTQKDIRVENLVRNIRGTDAYKRAKEDNGGQELSLKQALELNSFFDPEAESERIADERAFNIWRNGLRNRAAASGIDAARRGNRIGPDAQSAMYGVAR